MPIGIYAKIDTSGLKRAIAERLKFPGRTEAQIVNTSLYWIAVNAKNKTRAVSQEEIDSDLGVARVLIPKIRGGGFYRSKKKLVYRGGRNIQIEGHEVPFAAAIVAARANPESAYNKRTGWKWMMEKNPFKGVSRAEGRAAMRALVDRMIKSRHRSTHFIQTTWFAAINGLRGLAVQRPGTGNPRSFAQFDYGVSRGWFIAAKEGKPTVLGAIAATTGEDGVDKTKANRALILYGTGPLQQAIDEETRGMVAWIEKHTKPQNDKFNQMAK